MRSIGMFVAIALLGLGCVAPARAPSPAASVEPRAPAAVAAYGTPAPSGPHVEAGAELTLSLAEPLSSDQSSDGRSFTARVDTELRARDGTLIVPRGAPVRGVVKIARDGKAALLALDFVTVETVRGDAPLFTMLHGATHLHLPSIGAAYEPATSPWDAVFAARQVPGPIGYASPASSTFGEDHYDEHEGVIRLPAGARLRLVLTRPLALPQQQIARNDHEQRAPAIGEPVARAKPLPRRLPLATEAPDLVPARMINETLYVPCGAARRDHREAEEERRHEEVSH